VTADHGGHGRNHGDDIPEDMTIPIVFHSAKLAPGAVDGINIKDIAPTIAAIIGVQPGAEWEGVSLLKR
ncbi:MAG: hypothetical protein VB067_04235, partial [Christensenellaceae bacterium]|nr:hypothetical protein [Christensenellaceae bacterium]